MELSQSFKKKMQNSTLRMQLALKIGVSYYTIERYLKNKNEDELTKPKYLDSLCEISGMCKDEIFTQ